jgi:hypothetical protein
MCINLTNKYVNENELQRGNFVLDELAHMVNANVKLIGLTFMYSNL